MKTMMTKATTSKASYGTAGTLFFLWLEGFSWAMRLWAVGLASFVCIAWEKS
jgi:hypothetical protein